MNKNEDLRKLFFKNFLQWEIWRANANLEGSFGFIFGKTKKKGRQWRGRKNRLSSLQKRKKTIRYDGYDAYNFIDYNFIC